jgi:hypothetical protein
MNTNNSVNDEDYSLDYLAFLESFSEDDSDNEVNYEDEEEFNNEDNVPFHKLSTLEKSYPLESVIRKYCSEIYQNFGVEFKDVSHIRNYKKRKKGVNQEKEDKKKKNHEVDFIIYDRALIEAKNWDCLGRNYDIKRRDVHNKMLLKFKKYSKDLLRIVIIANPVWEESARQYLLDEGVYIIELGHVVTYSQSTLDSAFIKIKKELDKILNLPNSAIQYVFR